MRKKWAFPGCAKIVLRLHTARTEKPDTPQTHPSASDFHECHSDTSRHSPDIPRHSPDSPKASPGNMTCQLMPNILMYKCTSDPHIWFQIRPIPYKSEKVWNYFIWLKQVSLAKKSFEHILNRTLWMPSFHASWRRTSRRLYPTAATSTSWPLLQRCPWRSFHGFCWMEPRYIPLSWVSPDHILELIFGQLPISISVISPKNCVHLAHGQMGGRLQHFHFAYKPVPIRVHHPEQKL